MTRSPPRQPDPAEDYYQQNAERLLLDYERVKFEDVHDDLLPIAQTERGWALDVGCGSGRDAAWLAQNGWHVVAVDSSHSMLAGAASLHHEVNITWLEDRLPDLEKTRCFGRSFELILLSAVLMHLPPPAQLQAIDTVIALASTRATMSITVRDMGSPDRGFFDVDISELDKRLEQHSFLPTSRTSDSDLLGRSSVAWQKLISRRS